MYFVIETPARLLGISNINLIFSQIILIRNKDDSNGMRPLGKWIIITPSLLIVLECWGQIFNSITASCKFSFWSNVDPSMFCFVTTMSEGSFASGGLNMLIAAGWWIVGAFFFVIFLVLYKIIDSTPSTPKFIPSTPQSDDVKIERTSYKPKKKETSSSCNNCGKPLKPEAKFCGGCGTARS